MEKKVECARCNIKIANFYQLPCGKSICKWCIDDVLSISDEQEFECPFCDEVHDIKYQEPITVKNDNSSEQQEKISKATKTRYSREFLLSRKDKKLSNAFPEVLKDCELSIMNCGWKKPDDEALINKQNEECLCRYSTAIIFRGGFGPKNHYNLRCNQIHKSYKLDKKCRMILAIVGEYNCNKDLASAMVDFEKLRLLIEANFVGIVIKLALNAVIDRTEKYRTSFGKLLYHAVLKKEMFQKTALTQALKETLENFEDTIIDVPMLSIYLAQIISEMFQKDVSIEFLKEACEPIKKKPFCAELIAEIIKAASKLLLQETVVEIFKMSNLKIEYFLEGIQNRNEFLEKKVS